MPDQQMGDCGDKDGNEIMGRLVRRILNYALMLQKSPSKFGLRENFG